MGSTTGRLDKHGQREGPAQQCLNNITIRVEGTHICTRTTNARLKVPCLVGQFASSCSHTLYTVAVAYSDAPLHKNPHMYSLAYSDNESRSHTALTQAH